jgi:hypothetical protein
MSNLKDVIIKPNIVIKLDKSESNRMITFIKSTDCVLGVYTDKNNIQRCVRVKENETIIDFLSGELISGRKVTKVIDYDLPSDCRIIFEKVKKTIREIEHMLGMDEGSLEIETKECNED